MLYAQVVLGLPVEGPFDYIVPLNLKRRINIGSRVWVTLRNKKMLGYVVKVTRKTDIKNVKKITEIIDDYPILDKNMLSLTKDVSEYYCCSWGEVIETALPEGLRKGKVLQKINNLRLSTRRPHGDISASKRFTQEIVLIHSLDGQDRWDIYISRIKEAIENNQSVIVLLPDIVSTLKAKEIITGKTTGSVAILYRKQARELDEWLKIKESRVDIVLSTRSGIFAPLSNLGLVIIDEEQDPAYKQDRVPHYHARDVAFMRAHIEKAKIILGSTAPSLEAFYLVKSNRAKYATIPKIKDFPEIKIIDMKFEQRALSRRNLILSRYLEDAIISSLNSKGKILLFLNRRGFATSASCHNCGIALKCPRCSINLVYHFKENILNCHYCNFKMELPQVCPTCNSGYIKFTGTGTEKIESELSRIFAQARIKRLDDKKNPDLKDADIFVATSAIIKQKKYNFELIGVLGVDNALNRIDLRASEKTFALLVGLLVMTEKKLVIQTSLPRHNCFQALLKKDINMFYEEELRQRRQLKFAPYKHMVLVKLRGKNEEKVRQISHALFERLNECNKNKGVQIISVNPGQHPKLRGNFYWQLLISSDNAKKVSKFLKIHLKDFSHSGIIVTVDVDPIS